MAATAAVLLLLAGCQNNEQTGGLVGAGGGALLGGALGNAFGHSGAATAIGAGLGGLGGYFAGSAIGRALDERDRARAQAATVMVLNTPDPPASRGAASRPAPSASWKSDHNAGVRGSSTVVAVEPAGGGGECRTVREVAYVGGQEVTENKRYCRDSGRQWVAA
jgi:hypothetical protein